ncbi:hypothetical protein B0T09DRAFT_370749 [Sordaria sp. MPI-SDFR-AT-0083]|nr:hypothetical protein B0T09DRAFT_370749 [Sordaria sp. MPI-SDFR-AT-0083]
MGWANVIVFSDPVCSDGFLSSRSSRMTKTLFVSSYLPSKPAVSLPFEAGSRSRNRDATENVLGYKASKSSVVIANGSYPTTTANTTKAGNKDRSSGLLDMSSKANVVIAHGSWVTTSDKSPTKS